MEGGVKNGKKCHVRYKARKLDSSTGWKIRANACAEAWLKPRFLWIETNDRRKKRRSDARGHSVINRNMRMMYELTSGRNPIALAILNHV